MNRKFCCKHIQWKIIFYIGIVQNLEKNKITKQDKNTYLPYMLCFYFYIHERFLRATSHVYGIVYQQLQYGNAYVFGSDRFYLIGCFLSVCAQSFINHCKRNYMKCTWIPVFYNWMNYYDASIVKLKFKRKNAKKNEAKTCIEHQKWMKQISIYLYLKWASTKQNYIIVCCSFCYQIIKQLSKPHNMWNMYRF